MRAAASPARVGGFTLVELVVVIALLAVLSVGSVTFLKFTVDGYASSGNRADLASTAATATARIAADLEDALPNSARVSGACIEFVPVDSVTRYVTLPRVTAAGSMQIEAPDGSGTAPAAARVVVDPDTADHIYDIAAGVTSPSATFSVPDGSGVVTATFAATQAFANESPLQRAYLVQSPVSFCIDGGRLYRYSGYGFQAAQPGTAALPTTSPGRTLLAEHVDASASSFASSAGSLTRNAVVSMNLHLVDGDDELRVTRLVHLRHVP